MSTECGQNFGSVNFNRKLQVTGLSIESNDFQPQTSAKSNILEVNRAFFALISRSVNIYWIWK